MKKIFNNSVVSLNKLVEMVKTLVLKSLNIKMKCNEK